MNKIELLVIYHGNCSSNLIAASIDRGRCQGQMEGTKSLAVEEITPELAPEVAQVNQVLFVDTYLATTTDSQIQIRELNNLSTTISTDDDLKDIQGLLCLTQAIFDYCPQAWLIKIPRASWESSSSCGVIAQKTLK